jgi:pimeloyl-ACP methyl ester carboxylesterase
MKKHIISAAFLAVVLLVSGAGVARAADETPASFPPLPEAVEALESTCKVTVKTVIVPEWPEGSNFYYAFAPKNKDPKTGFIFYPGAYVDPRSYAPTMQAIAAHGYLAVIVKMVGDLAILSPDRANVVINDYPGIATWVIGGHSLGGTMACSYAKDFTDKVKGVVQWAAYPSPVFSLRDKDIRVISIFGTDDGLATPAKIEESKADLPPDTEFVAIEGGNHTQFGWYDTYPAPVQPGDNSPGITRQQQQCRIVSSTVDFLKQFQRICAATALLGKGDPQLAAMRHIRDTVLVKSAAGRELINLYYKNGEQLSAFFDESPVIKIITKNLLELIVPVLNLLLSGGPR